MAGLLSVIISFTDVRSCESTSRFCSLLLFCPIAPFGFFKDVWGCCIDDGGLLASIWGWAEVRHRQFVRLVISLARSLRSRCLPFILSFTLLSWCPYASSSLEAASPLRSSDRSGRISPLRRRNFGTLIPVLLSSPSLDDLASSALSSHEALLPRLALPLGTSRPHRYRSFFALLPLVQLVSSPLPFDADL